MDGDDGVDEAGEEAGGEHGVLFDEFGEVVQAGGDGEGEEGEAEEEAEVAEEGEDEHLGGWIGGREGRGVVVCLKALGRRRFGGVGLDWLGREAGGGRCGVEVGLG